MFEKLMNMNRQVVFILVAFAVIIPMLLHIRLPLTVSEPTQKLYDYIDALPPGSTIMIAFDYGPSSFAEPEPMAEAVMKHCFDTEVRVIGLTLDAEAVTLADKVMRKVAEEKEAVEGEDYVLLGYRQGATQVILGMGNEIASVFESDYTGKPVAEIPMMQNIINYDQIDLLLDLAAGPSVEFWITFGNAKYGLQIAAGVTGVIVSEMYPYLQTGQLIGLMPGFLGAAEYEKLINAPGKGVAGINTVSFVHLLIVGLVILGNIAFFVQRRREE